MTLELIIAALIGLIIALLHILHLMRKEHNRFIDVMTDRHSDKEHGWSLERQQLLDRIQSSSFAEYKTSEIKVIKAQSGEKEPPKLEQL